MKNVVYMAVTNDEIELPLVVADNIDEFATLIGKRTNSVYHAIKRTGNCYVHGERAKIIKIDLEGDDEEI